MHHWKTKAFPANWSHKKKRMAISSNEEGFSILEGIRNELQISAAKHLAKYAFQLWRQLYMMLSTLTAITNISIEFKTSKSCESEWVDCWRDTKKFMYLQYSSSWNINPTRTKTIKERSFSYKKTNWDNSSDKYLGTFQNQGIYAPHLICARQPVPTARQKTDFFSDISNCLKLQ